MFCSRDHRELVPDLRSSSLRVPVYHVQTPGHISTRSKISIKYYSVDIQTWVNRPLIADKEAQDYFAANGWPKQSVLGQTHQTTDDTEIWSIILLCKGSKEQLN